MQGCCSKEITPKFLSARYISIPNTRTHLVLVRNVTVVVSGILLFAIFIHQSGALKYLSFCGLAVAALMVGYSLKNTSILRSIGITTPGRRVLLYILPAILLGLILGILTRNKFGLTIWPIALGSMALISPCIGATEELVFRGYIQGHLKPAGSLFSIIYTSLAHTGYKLLVIQSLSGSFYFNTGFLIFWTFVAGIALGILKDRSESTIPPLVAHALFDIVLYGGMWTAPVWVWG